MTFNNSQLAVQWGIQFSLQVIATFLLLWQFTFALSDRCVTSILWFMSLFYCLLAKLRSHHSIEDISRWLPNCLNGLCALLKLKKQKFIYLVVCPKCYSVYVYESYKQEVGQNVYESKKCICKIFPNHLTTGTDVKCYAMAIKTSMLLGYLLMILQPAFLHISHQFYLV